MKKPRLGHGKNMSIAKAALKYYYEELDFRKTHGDNAFLDYGDIDGMHRIVTIAGANHCSFFTAAEVTACLANSPYWDKKFVRGFYSGMRGHGGANIFTPSKIGKHYYETNLKTIPSQPEG
jgi:hypothetical protein